VHCDIIFTKLQAQFNSLFINGILCQSGILSSRLLCPRDISPSGIFSPVGYCASGIMFLVGYCPKGYSSSGLLFVSPVCRVLVVTIKGYFEAATDGQRFHSLNFYGDKLLSYVTSIVRPVGH
jgi:hypothetical protein